MAENSPLTRRIARELAFSSPCLLTAIRLSDERATSQGATTWTHKKPILSAWASPPTPVGIQQQRIRFGCRLSSVAELLGNGGIKAHKDGHALVGTRLLEADGDHASTPSPTPSSHSRTTNVRYLNQSRTAKESVSHSTVYRFSLR